MKETVIKGLQGKNDTLCGEFQSIQNRVALIKSSHDALEEYGRRSNLVISDMSNSVRDCDLVST